MTWKSMSANFEGGCLPARNAVRPSSPSATSRATRVVESRRPVCKPPGNLPLRKFSPMSMLSVSRIPPAVAASPRTPAMRTGDVCFPADETSSL